MNTVILSCVFFVALASSAAGLSCLPCNEFECSDFDNSTCGGGVVKGICGCCDVCAKVRGETCGGVWNTQGLCDAGLECYKHPADIERIGEFNADGVCIANSSDVCEHPKMYSDCPSACPLTCNQRTPGVCIEICEGSDPCVCKEGFIMHSLVNRTCIEEIQCPNTTIPDTCEEANKEYNTCPTTCPATCDSGFVFPCPPGCATDRCVCAKGYVLRSHRNRTCIRSEECPTDEECPFPMVREDCAIACQPHCDDPFPSLCTKKCVVNGCVCPGGMIRRSATDDTCINTEECPTSADLCEHPKMLSDCASECPRTCNERTPGVCIASCALDRCICKEGFIMQSLVNRTCIKESQCPNKTVSDTCEEPEVYDACPTKCPSTCDSSFAGVCLPGCAADRCVCRDGYVHQSYLNRTCVRVEECSTRECPFPMVREECASACQPHCDEPNPLFCTLQCVLDECVCPGGMIRRSATNHTCITREECPRAILCEHPKIFQECASSCPPTCDNPTPRICTRDCSLDPCVCPPDHLMLSLNDRRCVHAYECPDFSFCMKSCPPMDFSSSCNIGAAWMCELGNWRCNTYEWKVSVEEWWYTSGCWDLNYLFYDRWNELYTCGENLAIDCVNDSTRQCVFDAFGCRHCECGDGRYRDTRQLQAVWTHNFQRFKARMRIFKEAVAECKAYTRDEC